MLLRIGATFYHEGKAKIVMVTVMAKFNLELALKAPRESRGLDLLIL
jgi:hypothetical protein